MNIIANIKALNSFRRNIDMTMFFQYDNGRMTSQLMIFFKLPEFFPKILQQQLSKLDFISYCGGSLGLFLGFSALSFVELLYYFSLKIIFDQKRKTKVQTLSGTPEQPKKNYLAVFLDNSSVHGCNQIGMTNRHRVERFEVDHREKVGSLRVVL
jgi:hypothetical protein